MVWLVNTKFLTGSIAFEKSPEMKQRLFDLLSLSGSPDNTHDRLESSHGGADRASITPDRIQRLHSVAWPTAYSSPIRWLIPAQGDHPFQVKPITDSSAWRSPFQLKPITLRSLPEWGFQHGVRA